MLYVTPNRSVLIGLHWTADISHIHTLTLTQMSLSLLFHNIAVLHFQPDILLLPLSFINYIEENWSV